VLLGAVKVFSRVNGFEIIHELVDKLCNRDLRQIAMRFISNQPHRENIAQRRGDQMRIFADEQLEVSGEIFICVLVIHKSVPVCMKFARKNFQRQSAFIG
jgi:hypothetical protein